MEVSRIAAGCERESWICVGREKYVLVLMETREIFFESPWWSSISAVDAVTEGWMFAVGMQR